MAVTLSGLALDHLHAKYAPLRYARARVSDVTGASEGAAKMWLLRKCAPHADHIGEMLRNDAEFRAKIRALIESYEA